jgi:hypothetical protein
MMEAARSSETSINFYLTTRRNKPDDRHLLICRRENLKSHLTMYKYAWFFGLYRRVHWQLGTYTAVNPQIS